MRKRAETGEEGRMISVRTWAGRGRDATGKVGFDGPHPRNPLVILNNKDPPAQPPRHRIRFPGNHLLLLEAIARHNGQVIHPLRLLARETTTAPGRHSSSPSLSAFSHREAPRDKRKRERNSEGERGSGRGKKTKDWRHTRAHVFLCGLFSSSFVTLRVARDCYRPLP